MGASKTTLFSDRQNRLAKVAKALGHPARIAILDILAQRNACICNHLVEETGLAQPTVSQHLKELKNLGFIKGEIEGKSICYCLDRVNLKEVSNEIVAFMDKLNSEDGCC